MYQYAYILHVKMYTCYISRHIPLILYPYIKFYTHFTIHTTYYTIQYTYTYSIPVCCMDIPQIHVYVYTCIYIHTTT